MAVCYAPETGATLGIERPLLAIYQDLNALSAANRNAIWTNFVSGNPPLWSLDDGLHADALAALSVPAIDLTGLNAADQLKARLKMVAVYLLDRPLYLVNPVFAPTVNVKPYVPIGS